MWSPLLHWHAVWSGEHGKHDPSCSSGRPLNREMAICILPPERHQENFFVPIRTSVRPMNRTRLVAYHGSLGNVSKNISMEKPSGFSSPFIRQEKLHILAKRVNKIEEALHPTGAPRRTSILGLCKELRSFFLNSDHNTTLLEKKPEKDKPSYFGILYETKTNSERILMQASCPYRYWRIFNQTYIMH